MNELNYAAIDIGSNAVRLLIKSVKEEPAASNQFTKILLVRVPLRLGADAFTIGKISSVKAEKLIRLMRAYKQLMIIYDVADYRACATSAMRDAKNGASIIKKIAKKTDIQIEIINGQEEARIIYDNHIEYTRSRQGNFLYVDVGGGSTEINMMSNGTLIYSQSYNIGTVRMLEGAVKEDEQLRLKMDLARISVGYETINIVGSGGNINKIFRLADKKDKKNMALPVKSLEYMYNILRRLTPEERSRKFKLRPDRADVIVPAAEIFLEIAHGIDAQFIYVPTIGLVDGIIDNIYKRNLEKIQVES